MFSGANKLKNYKSIKRRKLFRWLHLNRFDIIFLQETYSDPSLEDVWRAEWGGEILFAHGSKHSKGVMILFKPSLNVDFLEITVDKNGRFLVANININQDNLCLVNIYAPNDQNQQVNFFDKIIDPIRRSSTNNILLGGDFNCPFTEVDKVGGRDILRKKRTIQAIQDFCNSFDLVDVWGTQHPHKKRYSWENGSGKIKCRLDFWLISKQLLTRVTETDISAYYDSDHSPVTISLTAEDQGVPRGPGFWKFNNSLLENEEFVTKLKFLILNAKEKYREVTDKRLFWEMIKMERKEKEKRDTEFTLLRK